MATKQTEPTEKKEIFWKTVRYWEPYVEPEWKFSIDTVNGVEWLKLRTR